MIENDVKLRHHRSVLHRLAPEVLVSGEYGKEIDVRYYVTTVPF